MKWVERKKKEEKVYRVLDTAFVLLIVIVLAITIWVLWDSVTEAQGGQYWYFTTHYQWAGTRRVVYPVLCSGYICKPACHSYYGGWRPCR